MKSLLKNESDPEILENILTFLSSTLTPTGVDTTIASERPSDESSSNQLDIFDWLSVLTEIQRFDLIICFVAIELRTKISTWLQSINRENSEIIANKYSK